MEQASFIMPQKQTSVKGYIVTLRHARKGHKCHRCGNPILPREYYYELVLAGGGLGWLKNPERVHINCLEVNNEQA